MGLLNKWKTNFLSLKEKIVFSILLTQSLMFAGSAHAQSSSGGLFTPSSGDLSVMMLGKLFGGLVGNGGADPLKDLISTFNGAVLAIGGILVAYTIFAGTIGTAHDGEMLGRKFSSVWVPIRTALGTALVIPVNGYCGMQMLVMWLVLQGIGLADTVWSSLVQGNALVSGTITNASYQSPELINLANNMLKSSVCIEANKQNEQIWKSIFTSNYNWSRYISGNNINYGVSDSTMSKTSCGQITLLDESIVTSTVTPTGEFSSIQETVGTTKDNVEILKAHNEATKEMAIYFENAARSLVVTQQTGDAKQVVSNIDAYNPNTLTTAINAYQNRVSTAVQAYYASADKDGQSIKQNASNDGWIMAGAWFIKLSSQMSKATQAIASVPKGESNKQIQGLAGKYEDVNKVLANVDLMLAKDTYQQKNGVARQNSADGSGSDGFFAGFTRAIATLATSIDISKLSTQTGVHPIIQMKQMGDSMITGATVFIGVLIAGWTAIAGGLGLITGNAVGQATGAGHAFLASAISAAAFISPIAFMVFGSMLTLGFFLSYYIPMIPFLIWLGCLVGWFIMVMEAVIAAPLWAVMHLHPNGDDVTGRGGQGYMLVLGLLVRPTLMIFGLACALILSMVLGQFINSIFYDVFKMSRVGDGIGFFGTILSYVLYTTMMITFMHKMFSIIHVIPDQLLQWIGGGGPQLGGYAGQMVQGTEGQFMKAGGMAGGIGERGLQSGIGMMQQKNANALQKRQTAQDKAMHEERQGAEAARGIGYTPDQLNAMAKGGGEDGSSMSSLQAAEQIQTAQQQLRSGGASQSDLDKFSANVNDSRGANKSLGEAISGAKEDFYNNKFGNGASAIISGAAGQGSEYSPARERVAAGKLAEAQSSMSPAAFSSFVADVGMAAENPSAALAGSAPFNNPAVPQSLQSYTSSHGHSFKDSEGSKTYATAINAVAQAYSTPPPSTGAADLGSSEQAPPSVGS